MDNIFVMKFTQSREKGLRKKNRYALFIDLKATFNKIRRGKLWNIMTEKGINKKENEEGIHKRTETKVRRINN